MTITRTRALRLKLVLALATAVSCARRSPAPAINDAGSPSVASSAPRAATPAPATGFQLVAEFDYPVRFAPLGSEALLVAGDDLKQAPLALVGSALDFRSDLVRLDDPASSLYFVAATGGTWPADAWMALGYSSDAGPSSSDVYRWSEDKGWIK